MKITHDSLPLIKVENGQLWKIKNEYIFIADRHDGTTPRIGDNAEQVVATEDQIAVWDNWKREQKEIRARSEKELAKMRDDNEVKNRVLYCCKTTNWHLATAIDNVAGYYHEVTRTTATQLVHDAFNNHAETTD